MQINPTAIQGVTEFIAKVYGDSRGSFAEAFRSESMVAAGYDFAITQVNTSVSQRGVLRGLHYAQLAPSQAKYVTCSMGTILDVAVDIREGSATFGEVVTAELSSQKRNALFLAEGVGHAFLTMSDTATVTYLCSTGFNPTNEFGIHPLDPELGIPWPQDLDFILSDKDKAAPTLAAARELGQLPKWSDLAR